MSWSCAKFKPTTRRRHKNPFHCVSIDCDFFDTFVCSCILEAGYYIVFSHQKSVFFFFLDCFSFCFSCLYSFCFFLFFSYPSLRSEGSSKAKTFIFRLGAVIVTAFLLRCVLLLILLAIDLTSDIYLFITLMITEVLMMLLIAIELNKGFYRLMFSGVQTSVGATLTPTKMSDGSRASIYQHDSDHN